MKQNIIQLTSEERLEKLLAAKKYLIDFNIPTSTADQLNDNYVALTGAIGDLMSQAHPCTPNSAKISDSEWKECASLVDSLVERFFFLNVQFGNRECDRNKY